MRQLFKLNGTWSNGFITSQTYDLAGNVKAITYPSGRVVNYSYNTAGQLASFTGKLGGLTGGGPGGDVNYATAMQYNPRGQMIRETFGTNAALYQRKHYNRRGQLFDIRLGTDGSSSWDVEDPQVWQWANGSWNRGALRLYYDASQNDYSGPNPTQANNNGNVHHMEHFVPTAVDGSQNITGWVLGKDSYFYDELNRLTQVTETPTGGTGPGFTQKFIYDRWGNRKIDIAATSNVGGGVTDIDFKLLTTNNRLVAPSDTTGDDPGTDLMRYDKAGNLVYDNYSPAVGQRGIMKYDAENRMIEAVNNSHQYRYEADGKRTRRLVAGSVEMWLVYGVNGELVAEYDTVMPGGTLKKEYGYRSGQMLVVYDGTLTGDEQLKWMVTDHLGSTRMLVNRSGSLGGIQRRDYLPFGEELASTIGHRNAAGSGYVVSNNPRQKFVGYERDNETGLDFAQARYFSSIQGRFASTDPLYYQVSMTIDPQRFNLYAYTRNNPLRFVDPDGKELRAVVYKDSSGGYTIGYVDAEIVQAFYDFVNELENVFSYNVDFTYLFRTTEEQTKLYNNRANNSNPVAVPGTSAHESGLAFDINRNGLANQGLDLASLRDIASLFAFYPLPSGGDPPHLQASDIVPLTKKNSKYLARIAENQRSYKELNGIYNKLFGNAPLPTDQKSRRQMLLFRAVFTNVWDHMERCGRHGEACGWRRPDNTGIERLWGNEN